MILDQYIGMTYDKVPVAKGFFFLLTLAVTTTENKCIFAALCCTGNLAVFHLFFSVFQAGMAVAAVSGKQAEAPMKIGSSAWNRKRD